MKPSRSSSRQVTPLSLSPFSVVMCWKRKGDCANGRRQHKAPSIAVEIQRVITFAKMEGSPTTTIRWARPGDLAELVLLCTEHAAYERSTFEPKGKEEALAQLLFAPDARLRCLIAERHGTPIGYASFSVEVSTRDADHNMHMDCLFLRPQARNNGIGRELMRRIAQQARDLGVKRMQWQTPSFNLDAVRFYDRLGPVRKEKFRLFLD